MGMGGKRRWEEGEEVGGGGKRKRRWEEEEEARREIGQREMGRGGRCDEGSGGGGVRVMFMSNSGLKV
jgi:hypothetical protein